MRGWVDRILRWIEPEDHPSATVYGTIAVGLVLAAEEPAHETFARVEVATIVALAAYWLAHGYADWLAARFRRADPQSGWSLRDLRQALLREWPLVEGGLIPIIVLLVAWLSGAGLATAVAEATWAAAVAIVAFELAGGLRRRLPPLQLLGNVVVGAVLAASLLGVKQLLH